MAGAHHRITLAGPMPDFESAKCAEIDPELWYPEKGGSPRKAKEQCRQCVHRVECLQWALDTGEQHGVWGGLTAQQRRRMRRDNAA